MENLKNLTLEESRETNGGIIFAIAGLALGWMAIGAYICWEMAVDNRD